MAMGIGPSVELDDPDQPADTTDNLRLITRVIIAGLGGLAMWASFDPLGVWPLALVGIQLLVLSSIHARPRSALLAGLVWGLAFFGPLIPWVGEAAGVPVAWVALTALQAMFIAVLAFIISRLTLIPALYRRLWLTWICVAIAFTGIEVLRTEVPWGGFPWGMIAYSQVGSPLATWAPYLSTAGVAFATVVSSLALASLLINLVTKRYVHVGIAVATLGITMVVPSFITLGSDSDRTMRVLWVQGDVPRSQVQQRALTVTQNHAMTTAAAWNSTDGRTSAGDPIDVVLWPESSSDNDARLHQGANELVVETVQTTGVPLIMGTQEYVDGGRYNDVVVWQQNDDMVNATDSYSKSRPVPFGEYIPSRDLFRKITSAVDQVRTDMLPGEGPAVVDVDLPSGISVTMAVPICFEIAVDTVVRDAVNAGGEVLLVGVNNASFGDSAQSMQQLRQLQFRAMEFDRDAIQVSTVGVSAEVAATGRIVDESRKWASDWGVAELSLRDTITPAAKWGGAYRLIALALTGILAGLGIVFADRKAKNGVARDHSDLQRGGVSADPVVQD